MLKVKDKDTSWQFIYDRLPINLNPIIQEVSSFNEEWNYDTSRQDKLATHKDTKMFQLRFISYYWEIGEGNTSSEIYSFKTKDANDTIDNIYNYLESIYDGKVVRAEIIKMNGKGYIQPHIDSGEFLVVARRIHVPLVTNENVKFDIMGNSMNMQVGNWYEINNSLPHSVSNNSDQERTHIIIDILPNKYLAV